MNDLEIRTLRAKRATQRGELEQMVSLAERDQRNLSPTEMARFDLLEASIKTIDGQLRAAETPKEPMSNLIPAVGGTTELPVKRTALMPGRWIAGPDRGEIYERGNTKRSYFLDAARAHNDPDAAERLRKNRALRAEQDQRLNVRSVSTTNGAGGEFVPPLWLEEQFVQVARPARVTTDLCTVDSLPAGTDSLNIPKIATGTAINLQLAQNSAIEQQDITTTSVSSAVLTLAGGQTVSLQLVEQSPLNIDEVILSDLARAYAGQLNTLVLSGTGASGQPYGVLNLPGINSKTYTAGTITGANSLYTGIVQGVAAIQSSRFDRPTGIVTHPNTWAELLAAVDGDSRPIVAPAPSQAMNAFGTALLEPNAQGVVGYLGQLPVSLDSLMPDDAGQFLIGKFDDSFVWESEIRAEAFQQTYAQNMSVFVRLYNYVSVQHGRYPQSYTLVKTA